MFGQIIKKKSKKKSINVTLINTTSIDIKTGKY